MRELKLKGLINRWKRSDKDKNDEFGLTQKVELTDVKGYLQKEFDRAAEREMEIEKLEKRIVELEATELKYEAMLVVQEKTKERIERQDKRIKKLKEDIEKRKKTETQLRARITDIKINAEKKLKAKSEKGKNERSGV